MIVVLPTEERLVVPDDVRTIEQLRLFLQELAGFPTLVQRLFFGSSELRDDKVLMSVEEDQTVDLVLQIGDGMLICRSRMREILAQTQSVVFVPPRSLQKARRLDVFVGPPTITSSWEGTDGKDAAAPFIEAFERNRDSRIRQLRKIREQLDPGPVVVSAFNWGFRQMIENWVASCDNHDIDSRKFTILFPTDERADTLARSLGFKTFFDGSSYGDLPTEAAKEFADNIFGQMLFAKIAMTADMLDVGGDFLCQDADLVWLRDPRSDLVERMDRDVLDLQFMYDGPNPHYLPLHFNTGFIYIRSNSFTRHMWKLVLKSYNGVLEEGNEQRVMNIIALCLRERGLRMDRLPECAYMNGHVISRALDQNTGLPPGASVVHASWTNHIGSKIENMKKFGLWYLD